MTTLRTLQGARAGAAVAFGWVLHDLAALGTSARPRNALDILPASLVVLAIAGVVGALAARRIPWLVLVALAGGAVVLTRFVELTLSQPELLLPQAVLLLALAYGLARRLGALRPAGALWLAVACGLIASTGFWIRRLGWDALPIGMGLAALALAGAGWVRGPAPRRGSLLAVALGISAWLVPSMRRDAPSRADLAPQPQRANGPNLVLVVLDTVRADHLAPYGYERITTPGLDAFVRAEATLHTQCRSTSPFTLASHASMFTGLLPSEHHAARPTLSARPIRSDVPTLAERLRGAGYQTAAIVANRSYVSPELGFDRGFERFDDRSGGSVSVFFALCQMTGGDVLRVGHLSHRDARQITDEALAWLDRERRGEPFFLFLNYLDAHSPYFPPHPFRELWEDGRQPHDPLRVLGEIRTLLYDRELAYLDSQLTRLFDGLRERAAFDGTCIVVTSDHGEDFFEHGILEHCWGLYESLLHVPLYVKPAGGRRVEQSDAEISVAEIFHLAQRELGLDPGPAPVTPLVLGEWYPDLRARAPVRSWERHANIDPRADRVAWLEGSTKWIVSSSGEVLAFDLARDPDELAPLALDEERRAAASARAHAWWQANPLPAITSRVLDTETIDELRALGY